MSSSRRLSSFLYVIWAAKEVIAFSANPSPKTTANRKQNNNNANTGGSREEGEGKWNNRPLIPELEELAVTNSKKPNERVPWDAVRFVQQSSKFIQLPNPFAGLQPKRTIRPGDIIWSAGSSNDPFAFAALDDVVMGGASSSTFDNSSGTWSGTVTTANNGGFVGVRSTPFTQALDMSTCKGIQIKVRGGGGRRFKGTVRDSTDFNGVCWTSSFDTKKGSGFNLFQKNGNTSNNTGAVQTIRLTFDNLIPTIFARELPGQVLKKDNIQGVQFAYSKFEFDGDLNPNFSLGEFSVQIVEISGW